MLNCLIRHKMTILLALTSSLFLLVWPQPCAADWPQEMIEGPSVAEQLSDIFIKEAEAIGAKTATNAEYDQARQEFFADCVKGIRGGSSEKNFQTLLFEKDIYYLSVYAYEGMTPAAMRQVNVIDAATGGKLDGGIRGGTAVTDAFNVWVNAVRTALHAPPPGKFWVPTPSAYVEAIINTRDVYAKYKVWRDRAEFARWRDSLRVAVPGAKTPEEFADRYVKFVLNPDIEAALSKMSPGDRDAALPKIDDWRKALHQAIVEFETVKITPKKIADELRHDKYSENLIKTFIDSTARASRESAPNLERSVTQAQQQMIVESDKSRYGRSVGAPPAVTIEDRNRAWVYAHETGKLTPAQLAELNPPPGASEWESVLEYLYGPGQPVKFARDTYHFARGYLKLGKVYTDPRGTGQCR